MFPLAFTVLPKALALLLLLLVLKPPNAPDEPLPLLLLPNVPPPPPPDGLANALPPDGLVNALPPDVWANALPPRLFVLLLAVPPKAEPWVLKALPKALPEGGFMLKFIPGLERGREICA